MKTTKIICDNCGSEIKSGGSIMDIDIDFGRGNGSKQAAGYSLTLNASVGEDMDICKHCAIDAINKYDDRPKAGE